MWPLCSGTVNSKKFVVDEKVLVISMYVLQVLISHVRDYFCDVMYREEFVTGVEKFLDHYIEKELVPSFRSEESSSNMTTPTDPYGTTVVGSNFKDMYV